MAISHELILEPADISRVSIKCAKCRTEVGVNLGDSFDASEGAAQRSSAVVCPWCGHQWENMRLVIQDFGAALRALKDHHVRFRVPEPEPKSAAEFGDTAQGQVVAAD